MNETAPIATADGRPISAGTADPLDRTFSVAPMMEWTDRHFRTFLRLVSARALLYTEMVTSGAVLHGPRERLLGFDPREQPVALQVGGSDPAELAEAARVGADYGYREINLNVGCPSDRVQSGRFGACLMAESALVASCVSAMAAAVDIPVTVKCRVGIDDQDCEETLEAFIAQVAAAGCRTFIVHARKAWLEGLSPKQNRDVPALDYERVYRLKGFHPELEIILNGGIETFEQAEAHLAHVDGVMLGRAAYHNPYLLADVDARFFGDSEPPPARAEIVRRFAAYAQEQLERGVAVHQMTRHILGLYHGQPGARAFRRYLSENATRPDAGISVLHEALERVQGEGLPRPAVAAE
jgi:tRNA-dihydrouridine synthase A